jgi:outer membrane protein assembly factor BamB
MKIQQRCILGQAALAAGGLCVAVVLLVLLSNSIPVVQAESTIFVQSSRPAINPATSGSSPSGGDWPTFLGNPARTSSNLAATTLSTGEAKNITTLWTYDAPLISANGSNLISSSATLAGNVMYFGSWNGFETALNASTGAYLWGTFLGVDDMTTVCAGQDFGPQGVASSATVLNGTVYVGGGDGYWYALNATTGAVDWKVLVGSIADGYYNWASPLIYDGYAYVGVSSLCDTPLIPGGLLQVNLTSHKVQNFLNTTEPGVVGSSVWGSPAVDVKTNTVYFATGSNWSALGPTPLEPWADSIIAVNATNITKVVSNWTIPADQQIVDGDFGSTPNLFAGPSGTELVGALDKNGYFYVLNASDLAAGARWRDAVATPYTGYSVGSGAFGQGMIFVSSVQVTYQGTTSPGAAWGLNASTGAVVWERPLPGQSFGSAPAYANGLVFVTGGDHFLVLNASTGAILQTFSCSTEFLAPAAIAYDKVYEGCANGEEFAFGLPSPRTAGSGLPILDYAAFGGGVLVVLVVVAILVKRRPGRGKLSDASTVPKSGAATPDPVPPPSH